MAVTPSPLTIQLLPRQELAGISHVPLLHGDRYISPFPVLSVRPVLVKEFVENLFVSERFSNLPVILAQGPC